MATPFPTYDRRSSEDHNLSPSYESSQRLMDDTTDRLHVTTSYVNGPDHLQYATTDRGARSPMSATAEKDEEQRIEDDLAMNKVERMASVVAAERANEIGHGLGRNQSTMAQTRSRNEGDPADDFDIDTTPIHEKNKIYKPPANPTTKLAKIFKSVHNSTFLVRYIVYITPPMILLLVPVLLAVFVYKDDSQKSVGGVELFWFGIWLEIVWLTLWAGRILAKCIPYPMGLVSSLFTNNSKKWRDLGKALELPATLFFWGLAIEISFLPTMKNHHIDGNPASKSWEITTNKVIISIFIGFILNFVEKIIIQLIAISFHLRTYADRIEVNKFQIASLVKLYIYSKAKIAMEDSEFENSATEPPSGARTPMAQFRHAHHAAKKTTKNVFTKVGDVAGKVAGDFTGRAVSQSTHPHQVILQLLNSVPTSQILARRLYRTFQNDENSEVITSDHLHLAFDNDEEAESAFSMFDKDMNGDISMEELESVCVEIGRERKLITASLKDLDAVVSKLDNVFVFMVLVITILVFVSLISASASTALTSLGSTVLALSWLFSVTAQEFLQSLIFVFVKHPFDVGDRVKVYGNQGPLGVGDDYFVKEISLLYTEFKKMEGHVVQAPNSYLNTVFILNQRRSGGLAEAVPITVKFGTPLEKIETLREKLLDYVTEEKREFQKKILIEVTTILELHSVTLNVVFFYKTNWQNELLRLQRRNKFICSMMTALLDLGIEGPRMRLAGASESFPMYLHGPPHYSTQANNGNPPPDDRNPRSGSLARDEHATPGSSDGTSAYPQMATHPSVLRHRGTTSSRHRGESLSQMGKRVDFSLGMQGNSSGAEYGDIFDAPKPRLPFPTVRESSPRGSRDTQHGNRSETESLNRLGSRDSQQGKGNRFFGRSNKGHLGEEGTSLDDLEAGRHVHTFTASDMPDIPEASAGNSASARTPTEGGLFGVKRAMTEGEGRGR